MDSVRAGGTAARVIVGIVLALLASAAQAQPSQQQISAVKASCRSDFMAHCMSVQPGTREALQCLQQHLAQLSGACKTAVNATMPQAPVAAPAPRAAAAPAPAAKTATTPPSEPPAAIATPAVPPPAHKAATTRSKPVKQASAPAPTASSPPPTSPAQENGPVPGGLLVDKACARYIVMHCRGFGLDNRKKIACLVDYARAGNFVGPRCRAALKVTGQL